MVNAQTPRRGAVWTLRWAARAANALEGLRCPSPTAHFATTVDLGIPRLAGMGCSLDLLCIYVVHNVIALAYLNNLSAAEALPGTVAKPPRDGDRLAIGREFLGWRCRREYHRVCVPASRGRCSIAKRRALVWVYLKPVTRLTGMHNHDRPRRPGCKSRAEAYRSSLHRMGLAEPKHRGE